MTSPIGWRKTLHGVEAAFCKKLPQACETTAANTVAAAPNVGADPSRRAEIFPRDRGGEVTSAERTQASVIRGAKRIRISDSAPRSFGHLGLTRCYRSHFFTSEHAGSGGPNASSPEILARIL